MNYEIRHRLPGRLRLRLAALASEQYREEIAGRLRSDARVKDVSMRASCCSLTITYEPDTLSIEEILALLDADRSDPVTAWQDEPSIPEVETAEARIPEEGAEAGEPEDEGEVVSLEAEASSGLEEAVGPETGLRPPDEPALEPDIACDAMAASERDTEGIEIAAYQTTVPEASCPESHPSETEVTEAAAGDKDAAAQSPEPVRRRASVNSRYTTGKKVAVKSEEGSEPKKRRRKEKARGEAPRQS